MRFLFVILLWFGCSNSILGLEPPKDALLIQLRKNLFDVSRYHKLDLPTIRENIFVTMKLHLLHIYEINEASGVLSINGYLQANWTDARLSWQPENYENCTGLPVPQESVWMPDLVIFNDAAMKHMKKFGAAQMAINYKGGVYLDVPTTFQSTCQLDHKFYPFDKHTCAIEYGLWVDDPNVIIQRLKINYEKDILDHFSLENPGWKIINREDKIVNRTFTCCPAITNYKLEITIERQAQYFTFLLITPSILCVFVTLSIFWMPIEQHGHLKITTAGLVIFVLVNLLSFLSWKIPSGGKSTPLIVLFCGNSLIMATVTIVATIATLKISRRSHKPIPPIIQNATKIILGNCKRNDLHTLNDLQLENATINQDISGWTFVNRAFDRICFIIYVCVFLFLLSYFFKPN